MALSMMPAQGCEGLVAGPRGVVTGISDGDTLVLDSGLVVRLIGLQAPKLPLGRDGFEAWPLAENWRWLTTWLVWRRGAMTRQLEAFIALLNEHQPPAPSP